jgi:hypothetical protein
VEAEFLHFEELVLDVIRACQPQRPDWRDYALVALTKLLRARPESEERISEALVRFWHRLNELERKVRKSGPDNDDGLRERGRNR